MEIQRGGYLSIPQLLPLGYDFFRLKLLWLELTQVTQQECLSNQEKV